MSSKDTGPRENQPSNRPSDQATAYRDLLGREPDDVNRDPDNNWWDAPIPNRLAAAFHIGRLLNQFNWHSQHVLFFGFRVDTKMVDEVLRRLVIVCGKLVVEPPNHLKHVITDVRKIWKDYLCGEAAFDEVDAKPRRLTSWKNAAKGWSNHR